MEDRLVAPSCCLTFAANFLLYFGFWLPTPALPFYSSEVLGTDDSTIGITLSYYMITALYARPFSGYSLNSFACKPLYLLAYFIFMAMSVGCTVAGSPALFILLRIIHGVSFSMVAVGGSTVVIDVTPSSRRGESSGYYGLPNNMAMAVGPMSGSSLHDADISYVSIFCCSLGLCIVGLVCVSPVKTPHKPSARRESISFDRFTLLRGIPAGIDLLSLSIPYGVAANYVAMYTRKIGTNATTGSFFTFTAVGMAILRVFSGRIVDRRKITQVILTGLYIVVFSFFLLSSYVCIISWNDMVYSIIFSIVALLLGIGFGITFPTYNILSVNLALDNQRGTAIPTYLALWDVGISIGMLTGGYIAEASTFDKAHFFGACPMIISMLYFNGKATLRYHKSRLR